MANTTVTNPAVGCSPEFPGRVIAALATDPQLMTRSGGKYITAELARQYGITDVDGKVIPTLRDERGEPIWGPSWRLIVDADHREPGSRNCSAVKTSSIA